MRGQVEHGLLFWIGLVMGFIVIVASVNFAVKLWRTVEKGEDPATVNSFQFLGQQLEALREGEVKEVPYHIAEGFFLVSGSAACPITELCLCTDFSCERAVKRFSLNGRQFTGAQIAGVDWEGVENLEIRRSNNRLTIRKSDVPAQA